MIKRQGTVFFSLCFLLFLFFSYETAKAGAGHALSGWGWSDAKTMGWLSFNSINCDANDDGFADGAVAGCPVAGTPIPSYGVDLSQISPDVTGISGFGWSENYGWISFNRGDTGAPPDAPDYGTHLAQINTLTGEVSGWARALAHGGGWDGWISLRSDSAHGGAAYGVFVDVNTGIFSGFAWGSDYLGWLDFSGVVANYTFPKPPEAYNLSVDPDGPAEYCNITVGPPVRVRWSFFDEDGDTQTHYQVRAYNVGTGALAVDTGKIASASNSFVFQTPYLLNWGTSYYWRVKVWDSGGLESVWACPPSPLGAPSACPGDSFRTIDHPYPQPDFTWSPASPGMNEEIQMTDTSTCFNAALNPISCNGGTFLWTLPPTAIFVPPTDQNTQNPVIKLFTPGANTILLEVTDADGLGPCPVAHDIEGALDPPKWIEIRP